MNIDLVTGYEGLARAGLLVVGAFHDGTLTVSAPVLPAETIARLSALVTEGELKREVGSQLQLFGFCEALHRKIVLVCLGASGATMSEAAYRTALKATARTLAESLSPDAAVTLTVVAVRDRSLEWRIEAATRLLAEGAYRFTLPSHHGGPSETRRGGVEAITLSVPGAMDPAYQAAVYRGLAVAEGLALAKDLANMPGNLCSSAYLAETARTIGSRFDLYVEVFERSDVENLGMRALLAAGGTPDAPCKLIVIGYRGEAPAARPIILLGQGLIHKSGNTPLTPGVALRDPRLGMSGAAAALGTLWAVARLRLPINLVVLVPTAEIPLGAAQSRPGDIIHSMSGLTIEILSADAASRLILCDALSYAEHFEPACVIDVAPLSNASVAALGSHASGLFANDTDLAQEILASGIEAEDRAWHLPLWDEEPARPDSDIADMSHPGGTKTEAVTTAGLLMRFARQYRWAHIDIAGTAVSGGGNAIKGATGRPVPLLTNFMIRRAMKQRHGSIRRDAHSNTNTGGGAEDEPPPILPTRLA